MKYHSLGTSDLKVSEICLGTMTWGEQNSLEDGMAQMDYAVDNGVNFFDVAEMYPIPPRPHTQGETERIIGHWFKARGNRERVILATKVTGRGSHNSGVAHIRNGARLNAEHIVQACEASLKRLQTDYIDLYQVHWPERSTNFFGRLDYEHSDNEDVIAIAETLSALDSLVKAGKVRHIGVSNETPWGVMEYLRVAERENLPRIQSIQNPYNLLSRAFDVGLAEMVLREKISFLPYSPLAFGVLSGKYLDGQRPDGARLTLFDRFTRYGKINAEDATRAYCALAADHDLDPAQMALAWVNQRRAVTSNIIGATTMAQLKSNIASTELTLSVEILDAIDAIHQRFPNPAP